MIREHFVDRLFFSVTGLAPNGALTDADDLEAAVKRAMLDQAAEATLLLDASKLTAHGGTRSRRSAASRSCSRRSTTCACTPPA